MFKKFSTIAFKNNFNIDILKEIFVNKNYFHETINTNNITILNKFSSVLFIGVTAIFSGGIYIRNELKNDIKESENKLNIKIDKILNDLYN